MRGVDIATEGILGMKLQNLCFIFEIFGRVFPIFFVATVGGSIELSAFDKTVRLIELYVRFDFRRRDNSVLDLLG